MKQLTYKQLLWLTFWLWLLFVVGMSVMVTHEIAAMPQSQAFADFMSQFIPMLNNIRKIPNATEWVRFYYAVFWAIAPVFIFLTWRISILYIQIKVMPRIRIIKWIVTGIGILAFFTVMWVWPVADGLGWRDQSMANNILGVGHHSLMLVILWMLVGGYLRGSYCFVRYGTPYYSIDSSPLITNKE